MSYAKQSGRGRVGKIPAIRLPVTFEAGNGFVTAVFHIQGSTIGIKFEAPEQMLTFFTQLMKSAVIAWPDDPFIQYYLQDENQQ